MAAATTRASRQQRRVVILWAKVAKRRRKICSEGYSDLLVQDYFWNRKNGGGMSGSKRWK